MEKLTKEQQQLIANYISNNDGNNRIKSIIRKKIGSDNIFEIEDYIGQAYVALCKAAKQYNPQKGMKFSTFAHMIVEREMIDVLRAKMRSKRQSNKNIISLNDESFKEIPAIEENGYSKVSDVKDKVMMLLNNFEKKVFICLIDGYSEKDTAKILHCELSIIKHIRRNRFTQSDIVRAIRNATRESEEML